MAKIMIVLPNGNAIRSDAITAVRLGDARPASSLYTTPMVPRVIVDFNNNTTVLDCKSDAERNALYDHLLWAIAHAARMTREDCVLKVTVDNVYHVDPVLPAPFPNKRPGNTMPELNNFFDWGKRDKMNDLYAYMSQFDFAKPFVYIKPKARCGYGCTRTGCTYYSICNYFAGRC